MLYTHKVVTVHYFHHDKTNNLSSLRPWLHDQGESPASTRLTADTAVHKPSIFDGKSPVMKPGYLVVVDEQLDLNNLPSGLWAWEEILSFKAHRRQ